MRLLRAGRRVIVVAMRLLGVLILAAACARGGSSATAKPMRTPTAAPQPATTVAGPTSSTPTISATATATCPGELRGPVCDVFIPPVCADDEHERVINCRPICATTALCLVP